MIDRPTVERIKDAADIVDVVSEFVSLKKVGANYRGLCPFHDDHSPSFYVSPARRTCHCFVCGEGGDSVGFIMKMEQLTYPDALRWLARRYNIEIQERELTEEQKQEQSDRESMYIVNDWAAEYFQDILFNDVDGRAIGLQYFRQRGIREDIIRKFRLGFCLSEKNAMNKAAQKKGFKAEYLLKTGLCYAKESKQDEGSPQRDGNNLIDRFSGRVIFPWLNVSGKTVAFGGRVLDSRTKGVNQKYVNSPDSDIYHKDHELYGIFQAKKAITKENLVYMVEGYTDVISMHQCGIENVVANSGTALSEHQIHLLHRFTSNIVLLYDGDAAGIKAALRGTDMLLKEGMNVKVMLLPDGMDPDEYARKHTAEQFREYIKDHQADFISFKTSVLLNGVTDPHERSNAVSSIIESVSVIGDPIIRASYIQDCASRLGYSEQVLTAKMNEFIKNYRDEKRKEEQRQQTLQNNDFARAETELSQRNADTPQQPATQQPAVTNTQTSAATNTQVSVATTPLPHFVQNPQQHRRPAASRVNLSVSDLIMKFLFTNADDICLENVETEDGQTTSLTVAEYIRYNLSLDNLAFSIPLYNQILEEAVAHNWDENVSSQEHFTLHPDYEISSLAIRLTADEVLRGYGKTSEHPDTKDEDADENEEEEIRKKDVPSPFLLLDKANHLLLDFRNEFLQQRLRQLRQEIADAADEPERQLKLIAEMQETQKQRSMIAKQIGSCLR
jgi:DNA primase